MPAHSHTANTDSQGDHSHSLTLHAGWGDGNGSGNNWAGDTRDGGQRTNWVSTAGAHTHNININNAGSNNKHNNLQPYITVYIWHRTT